MNLPPKKHSQVPDIKEHSDILTTPAESATVQNRVQNLPKDPDFAILTQAWPTLPEHIKAAIKTLVETAKQK